MGKLIKKIKIKKQDGTFTDYIPIGAEAKNIETDDGDSVQLKLNKKPYYYNTVADMKADSKLKNGDMAVTLGYYEINDDGGALYKIIDTTSINKHQEELDSGLYATLVVDDIVNVKQIGAYGDGTHDDTTILNNIISKYKNFIFPNGEYLCNLSITKSVDIDFDNSTLKPVTSSPVLSIRGSQENTGYILSSNLSRLDTTITLTSNPNDISAGDFILIRDDSKRPSDNLENINNEIHQVKSIENNIIELVDFIRYKKDIATDTGTYNVIKLNMIKDVTIKNLHIIQSGTSTGLFASYINNLTIDNYKCNNVYNPAIGIYSSYNIKINNFNVYDATDVTAGHGYGLLLDHGCNNFTISNGIGKKLRHLVDLSSSFDGKIKNVNAYNMQQVTYGFAHNTFGSDITYENCNAYNQKYYGFGFGKQGVTDRNSFIGYNCNIINSEITFSEVASNQIGIMLEVPMEDSEISNVKVKSVNSGTGIRLNPVNNKINIHDCFLEGLTYGVFIEETAIAEKTDKKYMINLDNISINNCGYGIRFSNVKEIKINKTTASNITNNIIHFGAYTSAKTQQLKYIEITNTIMDDSTFIGYQGATENVNSDTGVFGKITNNIRNKDLPIDIVCTANSRIVANVSDLFTLIPSPDDLYFPIKSESAIVLATASLAYGIIQNQKCIIQNVGEYNITIPQGFLMDNGGSNYVLEPNKSVNYIYRGNKWCILKN